MNKIVNGMDKFVEYFKDYTDNYIIVGGTALNLLLSQVSLKTRSTKDIDMILISENLNNEFGRIFWNFIKDGQYKAYKSKDDKIHYYRFINNSNDIYPKMIELFSKKETFVIGKDIIISPILIGEDISSLSGIILEEEYYNFLLSGKKIINNISLLDPIHLIAFKAKAHVDLTNKKNKGFFVNEYDLKKHKNDIFRLLQLLTKKENIIVNKKIKKDIYDFLNIINEESTNVKQLTNSALSYEDALTLLKNVYLL